MMKCKAETVLKETFRFLFGAKTRTPFLGYLFAAVAGLGLSGIVVCCRKLGKEARSVSTGLKTRSLKQKEVETRWKTAILCHFSSVLNCF